MAYDKAVDSAVLDAGLTAIANAIREKGGTSDNLAFPQAMANAIAAIEAGGGGIVVPNALCEYAVITAAKNKVNLSINLENIDLSDITKTSYFMAIALDSLPYGTKGYIIACFQCSTVNNTDGSNVKKGFKFTGTASYPYVNMDSTLHITIEGSTVTWRTSDSTGYTVSGKSYLVVVVQEVIA